MTQSKGKTCLQERLSAVFDGVALDIITTEIEPGCWNLAIQNRYGMSNIWHETFATAEAATAAGLAAIEQEGAQAFMDMEGFEYMLD